MNYVSTKVTTEMLTQSSFIILLNIRTATVADAALLTDLSIVTVREAFGPPHNPVELVEEYTESAFSVAQMTAELSDPRSVFFLLEQNGLAIGYAKMRWTKPPRQLPAVYRRTGAVVEIQRIYLLAAYTGQGQGRLAMDHCLAWARQGSYRAVWLGVWERNERALTFYRKAGFERVGFHYFMFGSERQRDYWMLKPLNEPE